MFKRVTKLKKRQVAVMWLLVLVLVVPMILFFHAGFGGAPRSGPGGDAGAVFGRAVPWEQFQQEYRAIRQTLESQVGQMPEAMEPFIRQQTWDRLIVQEKARRSVQVSDEDVAQFLQSQPTFQQNGRFVPELYFNFVRSLGLSPQLFEERARNDLRIQRLLEQVRNEATLTQEELAQEAARAQERIRPSLAIIRLADVEAEASRAVAPDDVEAYYAAHPDEFRQPATRTVEAVGLSALEALARQPEPSNDQLRDYGERHADELAAEDRATPSFEQAREQVRNALRSEALRRELTTLALDLEDDAHEGLSLDQIAASRGLTTRQFGPIDQEDVASLPEGWHPTMLRAVFETPVGQLSAVQDTEEGVYLLRPTAETPAGIRPFDAVPDQARRAAVQATAVELVRQRADALRASLAAKQQEGLGLPEAAQALGVPILTPDPVRRQDPFADLGQIPQLTEALFALEPNTLSPVISLEAGAAVGWVTERLPASPDEIAPQKETLRAQLLAVKQRQHLSVWLEELRQQAKLKSYLE